MDPVITRVGWVDFGDYDHFGKRLYRDLAGRVSFLGLAAFGLSGREFTTAEVAMLDDIAVALHCPEPRVWPAKLARIVASNGRFAPGVMVGWAALDSEIGVHTGGDAARDLVALGQSVEGAPDRREAIVGFVRARSELAGFGIHGRRVDERVTALRDCVTRRGRHELRYWRLAEDLWKVAEEERQFGVSIWAAAAAAMLDTGLEPAAMPPLLSLLFQPSYLMHAFEGAKLASPGLRALPPEAVRYVGREPRSSPKHRPSDG